MSAKNSLLAFMLAGTTAIGGGGSIPPPPPPGEIPGGTWGALETVGGITYDRRGAIINKASLADQTNDYNVADSLSSTQRIDCGLADAATTTKWVNTDNYCIRHINGDDVTVRGGRFEGQLIPGVSPWNGGYHDHSTILSCHGLTGTSKRQLYEFLSIVNRADSISFAKAHQAMNEGDDWVVRFCALLQGGDDGIENDWKDRGTIFQNLITHVSGISTRPGSGKPPQFVNTHSKILTVDGNLIFLRGMSFPDLAPRGGNLGDPLVFSFFKWQTQLPENGMQCHLRNNILRWDGTPVYGGQTNSVWGSLLTSGTNQKLTLCENNKLLMPNAASGLPPGWPTDAIVTNGFTVEYGQTAKDSWDAAVDAWVAANPEVFILAAEKEKFA